MTRIARQHLSRLPFIRKMRVSTLPFTSFRGRAVSPERSRRYSFVDLRMAEAPLTRVTLLTRLRDGRDADAWREFFDLYGPVVYRFARNRGLQDADAADLMQDVLRSVARNAHRMEYDPKRGTFRGWLYTVTRNKIYNFLSGQRNRPRASGDSDAYERLQAAPAREENGPDADWEREYQQRLTTARWTW